LTSLGNYHIAGYCCEVQIFAKFASTIWIHKNFCWLLKILMLLFNIYMIKVVYFRFLLCTWYKIRKSKQKSKSFCKYFFWERFSQHWKYLDLTTITRYYGTIMTPFKDVVLNEKIKINDSISFPHKEYIILFSFSAIHLDMDNLNLVNTIILSLIT